MLIRSMFAHFKVRFLFFTLAGLITTASLASELELRNWRQITSPNFSVQTVLPNARAIELLRHLEVMRAALDDPFAAPTYQSDVPTIILAVDDDADYQTIGAPLDTMGMFIANARENAIIVQDAEGVAGIEIILHEFVHYLSRKNGRITLPRWFEEGRAEYLSQSRINDDTFEYGLASDNRRAALALSGWIPAEQLLLINDTISLGELEGELFYAQSWLLVHYLYSQEEESEDVMNKLAAYDAAIADGAPKLLAFERAFAVPVDELNMVLTQYLLDGEFLSQSVPVDTSLTEFAPTVTTMTVPEVRIALGKMAMRFDNDDAAERWFENALADDVTRPHAEAGLGTVAGSRGDIKAAEERFEKAIYLVSYDFNIWMDYAQFWAHRVSETLDFEDREFFAKRLEESLRNALTISDATPELNSLMGLSYLARGKDLDEAIGFLEAAISESPIDQGSRILLTNAFLMNQEFERAIEMAETVLRYEHDASPISEAAQNLIAEATTLKNWRPR